MKKTKKDCVRWLCALLTFCVIAVIAPVTVFADINYIDKISVTYAKPDYKAGDVPQAVAAVTEGECTVAYEYWREIYQKEEGGVWSGTGRYWYSDAEKMEALAADKRITQFEAGKHYSYNIVLQADRGYFINGSTTDISVGGYDWVNVDSNVNLEIKDMSTTLIIYSPYSISIPADNTDEVVSVVDIGNIWKNLDSSQPVAFTAEVNPNNPDCSGKMEIVEEAWEKSTYGESEPVTDIIKSTDTPRTPIAGGNYWYSIVLKAKDGYVFSDHVTFICEGTTYTAQNANTAVSDQGKTFTAWEFLPPVTVRDGADDTVIKTVEVTGAALSYYVGDSPKATAEIRQDSENAANYEIAYESWAEDGQYAYWFSDEQYYPEHFGGRFTSFEEGKAYRYSILLQAKNGRTFAMPEDGLTVTVNGWTVAPENISVGQDGVSLHATGIATIRPVQNSDNVPEYKIVEGGDSSWTQNGNGTLTFRANGDFTKFTGIKIDDIQISADNYTAISGSTVITLKEDYLKSLSVGTHKLTVLYNDGECSTNFEIKEDKTTPGKKDDTEAAALAGANAAVTTSEQKNTASEVTQKQDGSTMSETENTMSPKTGESSSLWIWFTLLSACGAGIPGVIICSRKRSK